MVGKHRGTVYALCCQVLTSAVNFLTSVIIARSASLDQLGLFSLGILMVQIARNFQTGILLAPMATIATTLHSAEHRGYPGFLARSGIAFAVISSAIVVAAAAGPEWAGFGVWLPGLALPLAAANLSTILADYMRRYHFVFSRSRARGGGTS